MIDVKEIDHYEFSARKEAFTDSNHLSNCNTISLDLEELWSGAETVSQIPEKNVSTVTELSYTDHAAYYGINFE